MFDKSNSCDFFAELFKDDDAFQKRPMFWIIEILKNWATSFEVNFNLFHADKPLARGNQFVSEVWNSGGARFKHLDDILKRTVERLRGRFWRDKGIQGVLG